MRLLPFLTALVCAAAPLCAQQGDMPPPAQPPGAPAPGTPPTPGAPPKPLPPGAEPGEPAPGTPPVPPPPGTPPAPGAPANPAPPTPGAPPAPGAPPKPLPPGAQPGEQPPGGAPPTPGAPSSGVTLPVLSPPAEPPPVAVKSDEQLSVVRVNVTNQPWDFLRPWGKRPPFSRRAVGAVLPGKRVLVTAELVANANYVELEAPAGGAKSVAIIDVVDYEANLAILKAEEPDFLNDFKPLEIGAASVGDTLSIWQTESTGTLLVTQGSMTAAEVSRYPIDDSQLLVYRATVSLQFRDASFTLPVAKDGRLAGVIMRYDNNAKNAEIIPAPVIEHFLRDAEQPPYRGFPRAGMSFTNTRDPQLRRFAGLKDQAAGGVYVTDVVRNSPAEKGGVQKGDILLAVDGEAVDQDGNYTDPQYGKISITHLLSTKRFHGEKVKFSIWRNGARKELDVTVANRPPHESVIEPYVLDRPPQFFVLGGLVLQELSRQYLKEWGPDWMRKAPDELVYLDRQQNELFRDGPKKIIFLSNVLPSPATIGYEDLSHLIVTRINGQQLQTLADVPKALAKSKDGLHRIDFDGEPTTIYLDNSAISAGDDALMKNYRLPLLRRLD